MSEPEKCDRCGCLGNDRRTLFMACFYAMSELGIPFDEISLYGVAVREGARNKWGGRDWATPFRSDLERDACHRAMYTLRVCKGCRGEWMQAIIGWFRAEPGPNWVHNNDASTDGLDDDLPKLLAATEQARTDLAALVQRSKALAGQMRAQLRSREAADSTKGTDQDG